MTQEVIPLLSVSDRYEQIKKLEYICTECLNRAKSYGFTKEEIINELKNQ